MLSIQFLPCIANPEQPAGNHKQIIEHTAPEHNKSAYLFQANEAHQAMIPNYVQEHNQHIFETPAENYRSYNDHPSTPEYIDISQLNLADTSTIKNSAIHSSTGTILKSNAQFDPSAPANYGPDYKNEFMSLPAKFYTKALQKKFPDASPEDISEYTNLYLKKNSGHYEQKGVWTSIFLQNDLTKPISIKPSDIVIDPGMPANSPLQKLYNKISGKPIINDFDMQTDTPYLDAINAHITNLTTQIIPYISAPDNAARQIGDMLHETISSAPKKAFNSAMRNIALSTTTPVDPKAPSIFEPETLTVFADVAMHHGIQAAKGTLKSISSTLGTSDVSVETKGYPATFENPMLSKTDSLQAQKSTIETSTVSGYLTHVLQKSAQAIRNSPQKVATFAQQMVNAMSSTLGYSKPEAADLQTKVTKQIDLLVKNKQSWFYKDAGFSSNFNKFIRSIVTNFNTLRGKSNPENIQVIQIDPESNYSFTPKIQLNYDTQGIQNKALQSQIEYEGYVYNVNPGDIKFDEKLKIYTITTKLYTQPNPLTIWDSMVHNKTVNNTVRSLKQSLSGKIINHENIDAAGKSLIVNPYNEEGDLAITFDPHSGSINTTTKTQGQIIPNQESHNINSSTAPAKTGTIVSTKNYKKPSPDSNDFNAKQEITLDGPTTDIFAPTINVTYDPNSINKQNLPSIQIHHTNRQTGKISDITINPEEITLDESTGFFTINTTRLNEEQLKTGFAEYKTQILAKFQDEKLKAQAEQALHTLEPLLKDVPAAAFKNIIHNLDKNYVPAMLKNIAPETYQQVIDFILEPIPTAIEKVTIEFNPRTNQIATRVIKTMSEGPAHKSEIMYSIH